MKQPKADRETAAKLRIIAATTGATLAQVRNWYSGYTKRIPTSARAAFAAMGLTPATFQRIPHSKQQNFVVKRRHGRRPHVLRIVGW